MKDILLIEDDEEVIRQITDTLNDPAYNIIIAETGTQGYLIALKSLPALIICSGEIYDAFGNDMLQKLRDDTIIPGIPFIFLINKNFGKKEKKGINLGFDYYIIKPFTSSEFYKIADIALKKYDAAAQKSEKKMDELRGSLSYALPHEFFTPLNGILGFTDILIKDFNSLSKDDAIQMLRYIHNDALRLKKLTENFLTFAQLEMISKDPGKTNEIRTSYFLNPRDTIESSAKQIANDSGRGNDLILELDDCAVRISEEYLKKVLRELINNAFKFSDKGTPVIVSLMANENSVMISISDNGIGMKPGQIASVGAYMQFDRRRNEQQGSGLGLIIAKRIIELHGGEFKIESTPSEGTKICIIFDN